MSVTGTKISVSRTTYERLHAYADERGVSVQSLVESLLTDISGKAVDIKRKQRTMRDRRRV